MNKQQEKNLRTLADGLLNLPVNYKHFNMSLYLRHSGGCGLKAGDLPPSKGKHVENCGTVGCAAGHGPSLGIKVKKGEGWTDYSRRVFTHGNSRTFKWCFHQLWADCDNTPQGAALRIFYMLDFGIPEDFDIWGPGKHKTLYTNAYDVVEE